MHERHHSHTHPAPDGAELQALLAYMVQHNVAHTEELNRLMAPLENSGCAAAAEAAEQALTAYRQGNAYLEQALAAIQASEEAK